jgi:hypothetical protein
MYFSTFDAYDEKIIADEENKEISCIICYDILDNNNNRCILFKQQNIYLSHFECNVNIHMSCLEEWYDYNKRCLICSEELMKDYIYIIFFPDSLYIIFRITSNVCYIIGIIVNVFCSFIIIYITVIFFFITCMKLLKELDP